MISRRPISIAVFVVTLLSHACFAQNPDDTKPGAINATATGRVFCTPDYLEVILGVVIFKPTAGEAQAEASKIMEKVLESVRKINLPDAEYQTDVVDLSPMYSDYHDNRERRILNYRAANRVRVRTSDLRAAARLIDAAMSAGANQVDSVEFGLKEYLAAREEAIKLAAQAAQRKVSVLAESLNCKLGKILHLSETSSPSYFGNRAQVQSNVSFSAEGSAGEGAFEPGKIEVTVTVSIIREIIN